MKKKYEKKIMTLEKEKKRLKKETDDTIVKDVRLKK